MSRDAELDRIKNEEHSIFERKQAAWAAYAEAKERTSAAHDVMEDAWNERREARSDTNQAYEALQSASEHYREVWDEYARLRDSNNYRIESLRQEANYEHDEMRRCFDSASYEYEYGDKSMASEYSQEGHEHKERRDEINEEVCALCREIKEAKENAEWRAPKPDNSDFRNAKAKFDRAKERHESAQAEFKRLKAERDRLKSEFDSLQAEHVRLKEEFRRRLEEVKIKNSHERDQILDKAGIRYSDRKNAKIVKKPDGTTQIYSGGLGGGDGLGHGHVALDSLGNKTYDRSAFEAHGSQNYTDNDGFTLYDRRSRSQTEIGGSGKGNYVDVRTGIGHTTQWYKDGYRISWDTEDNGHTEKEHWTNQKVPTGHPDRHKKPDDANS